MWLFLESARQRGRPLEDLVAGLPLTVDQLSNPSNRIDWDPFCVLCERLEAICGGPRELEEMSAAYSASPDVLAASRFVGLVASARTLYWASHRWFGHAIFTVVRSTFEDLPDGRIRMSLEIPEGYRDCPQFFRINAGVFRANPRAIGQHDAVVDVQLFPRRAVYEIQPPPSLTLWARLVRRLRAFAGSPLALEELSTQQRQLKAQFDELSVAHERIGEQRGQLELVNELARELTAYTQLDQLEAAVASVLTTRLRATGVALALAPTPGAALEPGHASGLRQGPPNRTQVLTSQGDRLGTIEVWGVPPAPQGRSDLLDDLTPWLAIALDTARSFKLLNQAKAGLEQQVAERTEQLRASLAKVTEANERQARFFANASHELRTPLTLMLSPLEALAAQPLPERQKADVDTALTSGYRLLKLVNDVLDLSKLEAGKITLEPAPTDLTVLLTRVVRPWMAALELRRVTVKLELPPALPLVADAERLEQVALNLVSNAVRYTPDGGTLRVRAWLDGERRCFSVWNSGEGIEPEALATLFERFTQGTRTKARRFGSTGLGLAVVKELVELHQGTVRAESPPGEGVTFTVTLPPGAASAGPSTGTPATSTGAGALELKQYQVAGELTAPAPEQAAPAPATGGAARPVLLVVEDNPELRAFIVRSFETDCTVLQAAHGEEGLAVARARVPDVVLSDLMMPGLDGFGLCKALKADPLTAGIPFLLLTARADLQTRVSGFEHGADDFLMKPFHVAELRARVAAQLRLRALATELAQRDKLASLGTLVAGVAHELRNPLNAIINALEPMNALWPEAPEDARSLVALALERGRRMEQISAQLLQQARAGEGVHAAFDVVENLRSALAMLAHKAQGVRLAMRADGPVTVFGDPGALHQVWVNLIDNALLAAQPSGEVTVSVGADAGATVVTVADTGAGIPPHVLPRIFDPFFTTRDVGSGTGLGLAIVRRIIDDHSGRIEVESRPGATVFRVRLPGAPPIRPTMTDERAPAL